MHPVLTERTHSSPGGSIKHKERTSGAARAMLVALILIQFFPVPIMPFFSFAPENILFFCAVALFGIRCVSMVSARKPVAWLFVLIMIYAGLDQVHRVLLGLPAYVPMEFLRTIIYQAMFVVACRNRDDRVFFIKLLLIIGVVQVVFGSCVYFFGEPFAGIRGWMTRTDCISDPECVYITKGSQMAGLYGLPAIFSYLIASFPLLGVILFYIERKGIWILLSAFLLVGVILNAERSAIGSLLICYVFWSIKVGQSWRNVPHAVFIMLCAAVISYYLKELNPDVAAYEKKGAYKHGSLSERWDKTDIEEVFGRLMWQVHGARAVLKNPVLGPSQREYQAEILGNSKFSEVDARAVPPPHNHYVNIGIHAGVIGWIIFAMWICALRSCWPLVPPNRSGKEDGAVLHFGIGVTLVAAMLNGLFHNAGVFTPELATSSLLGMLISFKEPREPR